MKITDFLLKEKNLGNVSMNNCNYRIALTPPWSQYIEGLASQAINRMYLCFEPNLSKPFLFIQKIGGKTKYINWTPNEQERNLINNLLEGKNELKKKYQSKSA